MDIYRLEDRDGRELISMEISYLSPDYKASPHTHHKLEISLVKSGRGLYHVGDRSYPVQQGDVFVLGNTEPHVISVSGGQELANLVLHFEPEFLWNFFGKDTEYRLLNVFFARNERFQHRLDRENPAFQRIAELILRIESEMTQQPAYFDLQVKILMETLLLTILREYDYFDEVYDYQSINPGEAYKTKEVLDYINQNLRNPLTLQELARIACLSPAYFSALFKRYNGITLSEYITRKRVQQAIQLITTTDWNLTEIASQCGFNSSTSFNKAFRRITGEAPSFYRKQAAIRVRSDS